MIENGDIITDITKVREGDYATTLSGHRYRVVGVDRGYDYSGAGTLPGRRLTVEIPDAADHATLYDSSFAYAEHPSRTLPDKPGLWVDRDGDLWASDGRSARLVRRPGTLPDDQTTRWVSDLTNFMPFGLVAAMPVFFDADGIWHTGEHHSDMWTLYDLTARHHGLTCIDDIRNVRPGDVAVFDDITGLVGQNNSDGLTVCVWDGDGRGHDEYRARPRFRYALRLDDPPAKPGPRQADRRQGKGDAR